MYENKDVPTLADLVFNSLDTLLESRGIFPNLDRYVEAFTKSFQKKWSGKEGTVQITDKDLDLGTTVPFFDKLIVDVVCTRSTETAKAYGSYKAYPNPLETGEYSVLLSLELQFDPTDREATFSRLQADFAHELTHAYDNLHRAKHGSTDMGSDKFLIKYNRHQDDSILPTGVFSEYSSVVVLAARDMYYIMSKVEKNAFVAQLRYELIPLVKNKKVNSVQALRKIALSRNTQFGYEYLSGMHNYNVVFKSWPKFLSRYYIPEVDFPKINESLNALLDSNRSFEDNLTKIKQDWEKFNVSFVKKVEKVILDVWNEFK